MTDVSTHWGDCWRVHLPCAVARIEDLMDRLSIYESEAADPASRIPWAEAKVQLGNTDGPVGEPGFMYEGGRMRCTKCEWDEPIRHPFDAWAAAMFHCFHCPQHLPVAAARAPSEWEAECEEFGCHESPQAADEGKGRDV